MLKLNFNKGFTIIIIAIIADIQQSRFNILIQLILVLF